MFAAIRPGLTEPEGHFRSVFAVLTQKYGLTRQSQCTTYTFEHCRIYFRNTILSILKDKMNYKEFLYSCLCQVFFHDFFSPPPLLITPTSLALFRIFYYFKYCEIHVSDE